MENLVSAVLNSADKETFHQLMLALGDTGKSYFLRTEILQQFKDLCRSLDKPNYFFHSSALGELLHFTHELLIDDGYFWLILRSRVTDQAIFRICLDLSSFQRKLGRDLLESRDRLVNRYQPDILEIDFEAFSDAALSISDPRNIGQGLPAYTQHLMTSIETGGLHQWHQHLLDVLKNCHYNDQSLLINESIQIASQLPQVLEQVRIYLSQQDPNTSASMLIAGLREQGLEPGWGNTAARIGESIDLLQQILAVPNASLLEAFLHRLPNVFRIVLVSVHGWVGQKGVLGKAETAGQVAYVLDQALYLERAIKENLEQSGLSELHIHPEIIILTRLIPNCEGTTCNLKLEPVEGTDFTKILRVPFRTEDGAVLDSWITKFSIWPYLEEFSAEAVRELTHLLGAESPDLIIGHYSDGNLVAYHLSKAFQTLNCNIAHALEKSKHLFSDLYWQDLEEHYHFSAQFSADLITMNAADLLVTSSLQEITGSPDHSGQYESYRCFTMPHLFHVVNGINLCHPKFNFIPPGVNEAIFFPFSEQIKRNPADIERVRTLIFSDADSSSLGHLKHPHKKMILAFSTIQNIKNLPELLENFAKNDNLRHHCNLVLLTGALYPSEGQSDEVNEILGKMHHIISEDKLDSSLRWIGKRLSSQDLAEMYRVVADHQGIFLHGASFEAFGLTLIESMSSGLPVFATMFGGPSEIIEDGRSGFLINPTQPDKAMERVLEFFQACESDPELWFKISNNGIQRVQQRYQWEKHVEKLLTLTKTLKLWKPLQHQKDSELKQYLERLYFLIHRSRLKSMASSEAPSSPIGGSNESAMNSGVMF